jgi:hypothetical protein
MEKGINPPNFLITKEPKAVEERERERKKGGESSRIIVIRARKMRGIGKEVWERLGTANS